MGSALDFMQTNYEAMLRDLKTLVESESPSTDKGLLDRTATLVGSLLDGIGLDVTIIPDVTGGNHVRGYLAGDDSLKPILILAHYDTVWNAGTLAEIPFSVKDGIVRGPGVFDMKAGLIQALWAIRAAREIIGVRRPIVFLSNSDEEIGSVFSRPLIEEEAEAAACALVFEASHHGALKTARKGACIYDLHITGRASHAGLDPSAGISAIEELADQIVVLRSIADPSQGTTLNVGIVHGGTRSNVVAAEAHASIDIRVASAKEAERVVEAMGRLSARREGIGLSIEGGLNRPPMERTPAVVELFRHAQEVGQRLGITLDEASVGGASDGNFCAAKGVPVIDGLGAVGDGAHAAQEHVIAAAIPVRAALAAELLAEI